MRDLNLSDEQVFLHFQEGNETMVTITGNHMYEVGEIVAVCYKKRTKITGKITAFSPAEGDMGGAVKFKRTSPQELLGFKQPT